MTLFQILSCSLVLMSGFSASAQQPSVTIEPPQLGGSRVIEKSTGTAVIRDYLAAWDSFSSAFNNNQAALLDPDFVGTAHDKLADTIAMQAKYGMATRYTVRSHDIQFVFYSPEGQSIELADTVEYTEQLLDQNKVVASQPVKARWLVVLTPAEIRWRVRIFQIEPAK